jgi:hypothetical protein
VAQETVFYFLLIIQMRELCNGEITSEYMKFFPELLVYIYTLWIINLKKY